MYMSKLSIFAAFALSSCMSLSHDIASELTNAQKTKHQTKIEKKISEKKSNLAFNVASTSHRSCINKWRHLFRFARYIQPTQS